MTQPRQPVSSYGKISFAAPINFTDTMKPKDTGRMVENTLARGTTAAQSQISRQHKHHRQQGNQSALCVRISAIIMFPAA